VFPARFRTSHQGSGSMPKIKTSRVEYPEGWELIEPTIRELDAKMREGMVRWLFVSSTIYRFYWYDLA
jgi:hypothetical protein